MKIVHLCLCGPVTDGWNYQDNMLTKYHKKLGYEVTLITSCWVYDTKGKPCLSESRSYLNDDGVKVVRLPMKGKEALSRKLKRFQKLEKILEQESPDILFIHGCQFLDISIVVKYLKTHPNVTTYVDNHADCYNSGKNWVSYNILHKIIWKRAAHVIAPFVMRFYGTVPARVDWLLDVYKLPKNKVELLVTGADDDQLIENCHVTQCAAIKKSLNINEHDTVLLCGGKIDQNKQEILNLMEAVVSLNYDNVKLIVFGSVAEHLKPRFDHLVQHDKIIYVGWIKSQNIYQYFAISDLALFPGLHSTLWEEAVGSGTACIFRRISGFEHIELNGNCEFFDDISVAGIAATLQRVLMSGSIPKMKIVAQERGRICFSYKNIAERCISPDKL